MTTLPADKLRVMCERIAALVETYAKGRAISLFESDVLKMVRALLELLPAEGEGIDADITDKARKIISEYEQMKHWPRTDTLYRLAVAHVSRQPGGEGHAADTSRAKLESELVEAVKMLGDGRQIVDGLIARNRELESDLAAARAERRTPGTYESCEQCSLEMSEIAASGISLPCKGYFEPASHKTYPCPIRPPSATPAPAAREGEK